MKILSKFSLVSCLAVFALSISACNDQGEVEGQGEGRVANPLNPQQAAQTFFEAYRDFDRAAAEKVSSRDIVNRLTWNRNIPRGTNLELKGEAIIDGSKVILLEILSDGHVGANVAEIKVTGG